MTEITKQELMDRGLEIAEEFLFHIEDFEDNKVDVKGIGGIYRYYSMSEGDIFIGSTDDLLKTLQMTINMYGNGNKKLQQAISALDDVYVYVYPENNAAMMEIYEGYLHTLYNPSLNNKNIETKIKKPKKSDNPEEEMTEEEYELNVLSYELRDAYREGVTPEELAYEHNMKLARVKYLIYKRLTEPDEIENFV